MNRRGFFFSLLTAILMITKVSFGQSERANVLIIMVDDMNKWALKNDYPVLKVPEIQKLRTQSLYFENATCAAPVCVPSRAAFFSGKYPHNSGVYRNGPDVWGRSQVLAGAEAIPELFKRNGYTTWGGGKSFHVVLPDGREQKMYDNPVNNGYYGPFFTGRGMWNDIKPWEGPDTDFPDVVTVNSASKFLTEEHDKPFFMYVGLYRPHSPYTAPKRFFDLYEDVRFPEPPGYIANDLADIPAMGKDLTDGSKPLMKQKISGGDRQQDYLKAYCANTSFSDWNIGRLLDALDKSKYAENTIVIFISDNGFHNGTKDHWAKQTLWEQADAIPFMVRLPNKKSAVRSQTVNLIDIYPTLVAYCELSEPKHKLDGISFLPVLNDPEAKWTRPGLTTFGPGYSSVRSERYRYIRYPDGSAELYDHETDQYEHENIAEWSGMESIIAEHSKYVPSEFKKSISLAEDPAKNKGPAKKKQGKVNQKREFLKN